MRQRLEKSALDASRQLHAERLSPAAQAASLGAQPSLAQCVAGLHTIWCALLLFSYKFFVPHTISLEAHATELDILHQDGPCRCGTVCF